ncbi:MAG: glycine/betaine ABC transporter substrate-binding protein [Propionibacteriales bacterium]|nr:glycine/betaine ABC transporter substrate-binding protein [Propionibacteriales bacterium]
MRGMKTRTIPAIGLLTCMSLAITACGDGGGDGGGGGTVTVGSKEFNEQLLLGQIAILALEDAGYNVRDETEIRGTSTVRNALESGDIDLYWEYTGTGWNEILGHEAAEAPRSPEELAQAVREEDAGNGIVWLEPADASNGYAIAAHQDTVAEFGVETLSDYAELAGSNPDDASLCAAAEFLDRPDGWPGIEEGYGFDLPQSEEEEMELEVVYARVPERDPCNFGEVFETDGRIQGNDLVVIEDDQEVFVKYNIAMTVREEALDENPEIEEIFNEIAAVLDTETLTALNVQVDVDNEDPEDVARAFLEENDLIG